MIFCTAEPNLISVSKSILTRPLLTPSSKSTERLLDFASIFSCWLDCAIAMPGSSNIKGRFTLCSYFTEISKWKLRVSRRRRIFMVNFESLPPLPWIKLFFLLILYHPPQLKVHESSLHILYLHEIYLLYLQPKSAPSFFLQNCSH